MTRSIGILTTLLCLLASQSYAENAPGAVPRLAGLEGVYVYVEPLGSEVEEKGITQSVLSAQVELRLREAGIPVFYSDADSLVVWPTPMLYLQVTALPGHFVDECVYAIRLELTQAVRLDRDGDVPAFPAATWADGGVGIGGRGWRQTLIDDVVGFTDHFIASYVAANPQAANRPQ